MQIHYEGGPVRRQGYGMLLAEAYDDRQTFELLWRWTDKNLLRAQDHLFSWRWNPAGARVDDVNDAADGDLLVAWALARAGEHWQNPADCGVRCQQYEQVYWCDPAGRPAAINLTVGGGYQRASGQDCQL